jgi:hypothetical protein
VARELYLCHRSTRRDKLYHLGHSKGLASEMQVSRFCDLWHWLRGKEGGKEESSERWAASAFYNLTCRHFKSCVEWHRDAERLSNGNFDIERVVAFCLFYSLLQTLVCDVPVISPEC